MRNNPKKKKVSPQLQLLQQQRTQIAMEKEIENSGGRSIRCLCRKLMITNKEPGLQWLIGSPFFPSFTIVSTFRCLHTKSSTHPFTPDFAKESDDLRALLLRGFDIIGALVVKDGNWEENAIIAAEAAREIRSFLQRDDVGTPHVIGAAADLSTGEIKYFVSPGGTSKRFESIDSVVFEEFPDKYLWERGCLIKCELLLKLPIYYPIDRPSDSEDNFSSAVDAAITNLRDSKAVYVIEGSHEASEGVPQSVVLRSAKLDFKTDISEIKLSNNTTEQSDLYTLSCSYFCSKNKPAPLIMSRESADAIQVSIFLSQSEKSQKSSAPIAEYFPASETAKLLVVNFKIEVLCYTAKDLPVAYAISKLVVPGLGDQLTEMKKFVMPNLQNKQPQLQPYHFCPPGVLHPVTVIYELSYGETEIKQVEIRKSLHLRLGLPLDRPLLLVANALNFSTERDVAGRTSMRHASTLLKDVHIDIPASGVSRGFVARVDGSYEYYHYLQDGINDSGWGCAYRSLQTIISWFRLQHYTSIEVPSHREIQQALVEIGDKEPYFIGSREWIGAIELSFVLDKLLGVSCKIINVRSGAELPEKCRELSLHFETQGTPVMIGGGVLAYTLLGVDYNEASGDCAFLILDPHYTGNEDLKKIVNGGWCGWKKAVDSKGKNFFLHDKFYNLLLPQRPNMV